LRIRVSGGRRNGHRLRNYLPSDMILNKVFAACTWWGKDS
jgi:hypothetical protein